METSFNELRSKLVVNVVDGKKLGHIIDIVFEQNSAKVLGFVVPSHKNFLSVFKAKEDIFIPYHCICKIGSDTILVQLVPSNFGPTVNSQTKSGVTCSALTSTENKK